ncbi:MAG: glutamate synthase subunit alpha, partial [Bacteroidales bacterium]|nr:glutamate synthase subunit alpha [Bacteroidales bacterium]
MRQDNQGLYSREYEHDACGIGMLINLKGDKSHSLVDNALTVLENMKHRGAEAADNKSGDGAGILLQIPHEFILLQGIPVPERLKYGTGLVFLPKDTELAAGYMDIIRQETEKAGLNLFHIREVPVDSNVLGAASKKTEPKIVQIFITGAQEVSKFETQLYLLRKHIERRISDRDFYIVSLSNRVIVYKGMVTSNQLREYYPDLGSPFFTSALAMVHSRFSTNTFPTWSLAQPFRMLAHNGEINTIRSNRSWMEARESVLSSPALGDVKDFSPIIQPDMSD